MNTFEIVVFENQHTYDKLDCQRHEVAQKFAEKYYHHFDPHYYTEPNIHYERGKFYLRYSSESGSDKTIILMLIGPLSETVVSDIKDAIADIYDYSF